MKDNWKLWLAMTACILVGIFCAKRAYVAFHGGPPDWIRQENRTGPALDKDDQLKVAWGKFGDLQGVVRIEAEHRQLPMGTISLLALGKSGTDEVSIATQPIVNQGFNPLQNVQSNFGGDEKGFVGFYTPDGLPIPYTIIRIKGRPRNPPITLHLGNPIESGSTQFVVRVESRRAPVNVGKDGKLQAGLGRFPRTPNAVYARAVRLPEGSTVVRTAPDKTATISSDSAPVISWIGTAANANAPMNVVFTLSK